MTYVVYGDLPPVFSYSTMFRAHLAPEGHFTHRSVPITVLPDESAQVEFVAPNTSTVSETLDDSVTPAMPACHPDLGTDVMSHEK